MRKSIILIGALAFALSACATTSTTPTDSQVAQIKQACAIDAQIRPVVQVFEVAADPQVIAGLVAARTIIDPICANPTQTLEANAQAAFSAAIAQALKIEMTLRR
jgi:dihydrodipicolinate synthase/N-acetylneuraminate lyase